MKLRRKRASALIVSNETRYQGGLDYSALERGKKEETVALVSTADPANPPVEENVGKFLRQ